jgi:hypothetical protein
LREVGLEVFCGCAERQIADVESVAHR